MNLSPNPALRPSCPDPCPVRAQFATNSLETAILPPCRNQSAPSFPTTTGHCECQSGETSVSPLDITVVTIPCRVTRLAVRMSLPPRRLQSSHLISLVHTLLTMTPFLIHSLITGSQSFLQSLWNRDGVVVTITAATVTSTVNSRICSRFRRVTQRS